MVVMDPERQPHPRLWILLVVASVAGSVACNDRTIAAADADDDFVDGRVEPCRGFCEQLVGPCGPGPERSFPTVEACVEDCATVDGSGSVNWGYDESSQEDLCFEETQQYLDCLSALSCEEFGRIIPDDVSNVPPDELPCARAKLDADACAES
jgi:hypothetical protein